MGGYSVAHICPESELTTKFLKLAIDSNSEQKISQSLQFLVRALFDG